MNTLSTIGGSVAGQMLRLLLAVLAVRRGRTPVRAAVSGAPVGLARMDIDWP